MPTRRKLLFNAKRRQLFLDVLRQSANVSAAARAIKFSPGRLYALRKEDADFRREWDHALEEALDDLEAELRRRAIEGVERPVYFGGKNCGTVRAYSDQLGMFILRSRRRHVFGDASVTDKAAAAGPDRRHQAAEARAHLQSLLTTVSSRLARTDGVQADPIGHGADKDGDVAG